MQNIFVDDTIPGLMTNSTLSGAGVSDILLVNKSKFTILNTTYEQGAQLTGTTQFKVQWYATLEVLDHSNNIVPGAQIDCTGANGTDVPTAYSDRDGLVRDLIITEYIQNTKDINPEFTYYTPYKFLVFFETLSNSTNNVPISQSIFLSLFLDFAPEIAPIPNITVDEDHLYVFDMTPYVSDRDDPLENIILSCNRNYMIADNSNLSLLINCPKPIGNDNITVKASDGMKLGTQSIYLTVIPVNDAPICILPIPDILVTEDQTFVIDLTKYFWDEENGTDLDFSCNVKNVTIDNAKKTASVLLTIEGMSFSGVILSASDGQLSCDSNAFNITCIPVNDAPVYLGGLKDAEVIEHTNWTVDLDDYFSDEDDRAGLRYECNNDFVFINKTSHVAVWTPAGNTTYSIDVVFTARDSLNLNLYADSKKIKLTYIPVDDPPEYWGSLKDTDVRSGKEWNVTLEDLFRDPENAILTYGVNNPAVKIIEISKSKHRAVWTPKRSDINLTNLIFNAYDGTSRTFSPPVTLTVEKPVPIPIEGKTSWALIIEKIPWWVYILLPLGIIAGIAAYYSYRKVKYGKYQVEQVFLINKDGRLLAHRSRKPLEGGGEDVISGMLTALQGFIKEFMRDEKQRELDELSYGDLKIVIERGKRVYLASFLSGYVTDKLKADMKGILQKVETELGATLESWDGTVKMLEGLDKHLEKLIGEAEETGKDKK